MEIADIKLECAEEIVADEEVGVERSEKSAESRDVDEDIDIDIDKLLSTACLMKDSLLSQRMHQKKTNILHPSLKLICSDAVDIKSIREKIHQLSTSAVTVTASEEKSNATTEEARELICVHSVQETPSLSVVRAHADRHEDTTQHADDCGHYIVHDCIEQVNTLTQTAEALTLKVLQEEYLLAMGNRKRTAAVTATASPSPSQQQQQQQPRPSLNSVITHSLKMKTHSTIRSNNTPNCNSKSNSATETGTLCRDFSCSLERYQHLQELSLSLARSGAEVTACVQSQQEQLLQKWEQRVSRQSALQTVQW